MLLALGASLRRFGIKRILLIAAQSLRFGLFILGEPTWLMAAALSLHGFVFTLYSVGLAIAVDELNSVDNRASAQGLMSLVRGGATRCWGTTLRVWPMTVLPSTAEDTTGRHFFCGAGCRNRCKSGDLRLVVSRA